MPRLPPPPAEQMRLESLAEVARGGMGSVELARVVEGRLSGQVLAVKRLHANIAEDPEFVAMFLDEACITAALKHPNVAQVIAWGNDDAGTFLAIELVQGVSLSRLLKEAQSNQEPFAERTVAYICSQICAGLSAAHGLTMPDGTPLGVVHRDLTPANVLVSFDGIVKIIDFGIAKAEERITHTRTGQLKGKPSYMAPEQQRGGHVDHRADLFAFGVTMFELLAGRRPWTSKGAFDVMMEIANDPHPDLGELRKGLNPEFVEIAHRCLDKKAENRFNSAGEIKARLDAWLASKGFASDDQQSLAHFVQRNSQPQIKWWQEALRGEHAKKKAPTFKELEEKIDADREKKTKAQRAVPPPRPAAGGGPKPPTPATPKFTGTHPAHPGPQSVARPAHGPRAGSAPSRGTVPMAAFSGGAGPAALGQSPTPFPGAPSAAPPSGQPVSSGPMTPQSPSSGQQPVPSSGQHAVPSSGQQLPSSSGQYAAVAQGTSSSGQYAAVQGAPPVSQRNPLSGTEFMSAVPMPSAAPPSPRAPEHNLGGTEFMGSSPFHVAPAAPQARPHAGAVEPPHPLSQRVISSGDAPSTPSPGLQAAPPGMGGPMQSAPPGMGSAMQTTPPGMAGAMATVPPGSAPNPAAMATVPPATTPPKKRRVGLVIALIAIPLVGAAVGGWFFRDEILNLGETNATRSHPAGKTR
jgi:eukaryotic-like serine/threonine-protein kinase